MTVKCDYCDRPAELVTGSAIYPHRPDLFGKFFWQCKQCDAWVGCHPKNTHRKHLSDGTVPMGRLANAELRKAKMAAHGAFDRIWRSGEMDRREAYKWLGEQLGLAPQHTHIGMFDVDTCLAVVAACKARRPA